MVIKKFTAKTQSAAEEMAKKALGNDIVIMTTRNVKSRGAFSFLRKPLVELTVAKAEESDKKEPEPAAAEKAAVYIPSPAAQAAAVSHAGGQTPATPFGRTMADMRFSNPGVSAAAGNSNALGTDIEERLNNLQKALEESLIEKDKKHGENIAEANPAKEEEFVSNDMPQESLAFIQLLYNTMLENEVSEIYVNQIIDEIEKVIKPGVTIDQLLANIYQKMILKFGMPEYITKSEKGPKVVFFIGPTGVGKTTTIAKLSSRHSLEQKNKVALLTADTFRIAAADQLKTYANILDIPFKVIYGGEDVEGAIKDFNDYDYIFVDTAGHSYQNAANKESILQLLDGLPKDIEYDVYLVVSATTKYRDLVGIADSYSSITRYRLVFTKLDETSAIGNLLNLRLHTGAPLSYVTCGQNVPDDIEQFNPQATVKLLLGGKG